VTVAYWGEEGRAHSTAAKVRKYRQALAVISPQCMLVCVMSDPTQLAWGLLYALLAKRLVGAEVHLVLTHHSLYTAMMARLGKLQCPQQYSEITEMFPVHLLPLEYVYLGVEFPRSPRMQVWCDDVCWAAVRVLRPHAQRWTATAEPRSAVEVEPERGHWRWEDA
jgi:hypothetical protein